MYQPPITYIPEKDLIKSQDFTLKIKVSNDMYLTITIFHQGTPEQFLSHVQMVLETIHQRKLDKAFEDACKEDKEAEKKLVKVTEAKDGYRGTDENPPVVKSWKKATAAKTHTGENIESTIQPIFLQYSTLLLEEASQPWAKIVKEQIDTAPFTNIYGVQHHEKHPRSWNSFMECVQLHLQSVFRYDAAETLRFYISNGLKKPNRVPIRDFVQRIQHLNGIWNSCHACSTLQSR